MIQQMILIMIKLYLKIVIIIIIFKSVELRMTNLILILTQCVVTTFLSELILWRNFFSFFLLLI